MLVEVCNKTNIPIKVEKGTEIGTFYKTKTKLDPLVVTLKEDFEGLEIVSGQTKDVSGYVEGLDDETTASLDNISTLFLISQIPYNGSVPYIIPNKSCTSPFFKFSKHALAPSS